MSPSGKATDSDSVIRGFESLHPSQEKQVAERPVFLLEYDKWRDERVGAVLREQNALPTNKQMKQEKYAAKAAIDNCRAGRAAKSENPSTPAKKQGAPFWCALFFCIVKPTVNRFGVPWVCHRILILQ